MTGRECHGNKSDRLQVTGVAHIFPMDSGLSQGQGTKKVVNKHQCGNDLDSSALLNNADKYARFDDANCNG